MSIKNKLVAICLSLCVLWIFSAAVGADTPTVSETTLPNGLRVITKTNHSVALVAVDVWVRAGSSRQTPAQKGVAHYLEHVLFKGTPTYSTEQDIDGAFEDLGGSFDASTSYDWAHFYVELPSSNFEAALGVLADVLQHSTLSPSFIEEERPIVLGEIARSQNSPTQVMLQEIRRITYGVAHPYGSMVTGTVQDVKKVTADQVAAFYHKWYAPNNIALVVTGDVDADRVNHAAEKLFHSWELSQTLGDQPSPRSVDLDSVRRTVLSRPVSHSYMMIGLLAPSVQDKPDVWVMDVLMTLLGQGGNNRLDQDLRLKQHLTDSISTDYLTQRGQGLLTVTSSFPSGNSSEVEHGVIAEVKRLIDEPISDSDLYSAKQALLASYLFDCDTDSGRADSLGFYDMIDSYQYDVDYLDHVQSVTAADIRRVAAKYFNPNAYSIVTIVPLNNVTTASAAQPSLHLSAAEGRH